MPDRLKALLDPRADTVPAGRGGRAFGGALLARTLLAAAPSAHVGGRVHSLHASFLNPGVPSRAADYDSVVLRASRRFTAVRVDVRQERLITTATVSFHSPESTTAHGPHASVLEIDPRLLASASGDPIPEPCSPIREPFEFRGGEITHDPAGRPVASYWVRLREPLDDDPSLHAAALLWASDFSLTRVADLEHQHEPGERQAASLDQTTWFHATVDLNKWLRYDITSPVYREGLALSQGTFSDATGTLVATVCQESLLRRTRP